MLTARPAPRVRAACDHLLGMRGVRVGLVSALPRVSVAGLLLALALPVADGGGEPPTHDHGMHVIPPGREAAAREMLAPIIDVTGPELRWAGPEIEIDRIEWLLLRGEQVRARLMLIPRELATAGDPISQSFAISVAWEAEPEAGERA